AAPAIMLVICNLLFTIHYLLFPAPARGEERSAPLSQEQTLKMLQAGVSSRQIETFARRDGVDFKVTPALERDLRKAGATEGLIQLLKMLGSGPAPAPPVAPAGS